MLSRMQTHLQKTHETRGVGQDAGGTHLPVGLCALMWPPQHSCQVQPSVEGMHAWPAACSASSQGRASESKYSFEWWATVYHLPGTSC